MFMNEKGPPEAEYPCCLAKCVCEMMYYLEIVEDCLL